MKSNKIIYFPFAPGVPWQLKNNRYIIPTMVGTVWERIISDKNLTMIGFGGLFESYFALSILEFLNISNPSASLYWIGDKRFNYMVHRNGLAKIKKTINEEQLKEYPAPLFFDDSDEVAYLNYLNNYINVKSYYQKFGYHDKCAVSKQIFRNIFIDWHINYIPKVRNSEISPELNTWCIKENIHLDRKYVLLFPDSFNYSKHNNSCIDWGTAQIKSFSAMLAQQRINLIIASQCPEKYYGSRLHVAPDKFEFLLPLLESSSVVISKDIDFLLIGLLMGKNIVSNTQKGEFDLNKNYKFLFDGSGPDIFLDKSVSPLQAFTEITNM